ncbi:putative receptor-like protein kinase At3g47110 [Durio zibethinus]|uniref:Receptor-like protein kinase At3g47110 n=1 Tax=Durio zibethinus TaxID=66656 RepID=A0A6P6AHB4_DURZI|nr:putative receptor-like protein kinase At3g47110 [Durio zibethinus]
MYKLRLYKNQRSFYLHFCEAFFFPHQTSFVAHLNQFPSLPISSFSFKTDRLALLALKDRLVGGSPGALTSWNASLHFCEWQGVRCGHRYQRVISLNVSSMKLVGSISPSIGNLTFLREVNFSRNRLQGSIPRELGHLRRLRLLALGHNNLQGIIPVVLSNCSNFQVIYLDYNNLTGEIPFQLGNVKNLIVLQLSINNLIGGYSIFFRKSFILDCPLSSR